MSGTFSTTFLGPPGRLNAGRRLKDDPIENRLPTPFPTEAIVTDEEAVGVLKISRLFHKKRGLTIKLEGELLGPWVGSVRAACAGRDGRRLCLDLAAVPYVDTAGVQLLRELVAEGAEIVACSCFVGELLHPEP